MAKALVLIGVSGSRIGQQTALTGRSNVVGSASGCDLVLHDRQILGRHAEIAQALDRWFITPLDAAALVSINGQRVSARSRIGVGDLVSIGGATFKATIEEFVERAAGGR